MTIAFDIDGTWSRDPAMFRRWCELALAAGHQCIIVTGREQREDKIQQLGIPLTLPLIISGAMLKEDAARKSGYAVDIWLDDMPGMIQECRILRGDLELEE